MSIYHISVHIFFVKNDVEILRSANAWNRGYHRISGILAWCSARLCVSMWQFWFHFWSLLLMSHQDGESPHILALLPGMSASRSVPRFQPRRLCSVTADPSGRGRQLHHHHHHHHHHPVHPKLVERGKQPTGQTDVYIYIYIFFFPHGLTNCPCISIYVCHWSFVHQGLEVGSRTPDHSAGRRRSCLAGSPTAGTGTWLLFSDIYLESHHPKWFSHFSEG